MLRIALPAFTLAVCLCAPGVVLAGENAPNGELKILYAGDPGGAREKAWTEFLAKSFRTVDSISLTKLDTASAAGYDVIVADWIPRYKDGDYDSGARKHGTSLTKDFTKPIIMIGAVGAELTRAMKLKTNWL